MEISKLLGLFSNDALTCAERVAFSKWQVNGLKQFLKAVNKRRGYSIKSYWVLIISFLVTKIKRQIGCSLL